MQLSKAINKGESQAKTTQEAEKPDIILFAKNSPLFKTLFHFLVDFKRRRLMQISRFFEISKKIHINILFANVLEQMPNYAKFMMEVMSKKRQLEDFETIKLT